MLYTRIHNKKANEEQKGNLYTDSELSTTVGESWLTVGGDDFSIACEGRPFHNASYVHCILRNLPHHQKEEQTVGENSTLCE